jgi:hypothetical protein
LRLLRETAVETSVLPGFGLERENFATYLPEEEP